MTAELDPTEVGELARSLADAMNGGVLRDRHSWIAQAMLASDWLKKRDAENLRKTIEILLDEAESLSDHVYGMGVWTAIHAIERAHNLPQTDVLAVRVRKDGEK